MMSRLDDIEKNIGWTDPRMKEIRWLCAKLKEAEKGLNGLVNDRLLKDFQVGEPMIESEFSLDHFRDQAAKLLKSIMENKSDAILKIAPTEISMDGKEWFKVSPDEFAGIMEQYVAVLKGWA